MSLNQTALNIIANKNTHSIDGDIQTRIVKLTTNDSVSQYVVRDFLPNDYSYTTLAVECFPALATRVNGFNSLIGLDLMRQNIPLRIIGNDQSMGHSLIKSAQDSLIINRHLPLPSRFDSTKDKWVIFGYSMGAMKALALESIAADYPDQQLASALLIDPCLATTHSLADLSSRINLRYYLKELSELTWATIEFSQNQFTDQDIFKTIAYNPIFLAKVLDNLFSLLHQPSAEYIKTIPQEAHLVIHFFKNSVFNDYQAYIAALNEHLESGNSRVIIEPGVHLSGARYTQYHNILKKLIHLSQAGVKANIDHPLLGSELGSTV